MIDIGADTLTSGGGRPGIPIRFAFLDGAWAAEVAALQDAAVGDLMYPITPAQIDQMLGADGRTVGVLADGRLIGFFAVLFPGDSSDSMGLDFGLAAAELSAVVHWTAVIVDPAFRGHRLQHRMIAAVGDRFFPAATREYWFATARVDNRPSVRSFLRAGFAIFKAARKFDGHLRYTVFRIPGVAGVAVGSRGLAVAWTDIDAQQRLFADGQVAYAVADDGAALLFARRQPGRPAVRSRDHRSPPPDSPNAL